MKTQIYSSAFILLICLSSVHLLSLKSSLLRVCKSREEVFGGHTGNAPKISAAPVIPTDGTPNVRYVRFDCHDEPGKMLHISQVVVNNLAGENVSIARRTSATKPWIDTCSSMAVTGILKNFPVPFSYSAAEPGKAFWEVDLGVTQTVKEVIYYNRGEENSPHLWNRIIGTDVSLLDTNRKVISSYKIKTGALITTIPTPNEKKLAVIPQPAPKAGVSGVRYVRVRSAEKANGWLQISQLTVWNEKGVNVALRKPTSASSLYVQHGVATKNAVDGIEMPRLGNKIFLANTPNGAWWMVDLEKPESIVEVVYTNRLDAHVFIKDRIQGAKVELLDSEQQVLKTLPINTFEDRIPLQFA